MRHPVRGVFVGGLLLALLLFSCPGIAAEEAAEDPFTQWLTEEDRGEALGFAEAYWQMASPSDGGFHYAPDWEACVLSPHETAEAGGVRVEISDVLYDAFNGDVRAVISSDLYQIRPMNCLASYSAYYQPIESWPSPTCFVEISVCSEGASCEPEAMDYSLSADGRTLVYDPSYLCPVQEKPLRLLVSLAFWRDGQRTNEEIVFTFPDLPLPLVDQVRLDEPIVNEKLNREVRSVSFSATPLRMRLSAFAYVPGDAWIAPGLAWEKIRPRIYAEDGTVLYNGTVQNNAGTYISRFPDTAYFCWYDYEAEEIMPGTEPIRLIRDGDQLRMAP